MGSFRQLLWWGQLAGCYLFVFFSPFSIAGAQIGLVVVLGFWLLDFIFEFPRPFPAGFLAGPVLFYAAAALLAVFFGVDFKSSASGLLELWLFLPLFFFSRRLHDGALRRRVFDVLVFSAGIIAAYAILQHFTGWHPHRPEPLDQIGNRFRAVGTFSTPLTFGLYFALIAVACFSLGWEERNQRRGKFYIFVSFLSFLAVLYNIGRAAQLSLLVGFLLTLFFLKTKGRWQVAASILAVTLAAYFASPEIFTRFRQLKHYELEPASPNRRLAIWERSYRIFQDHPVFGIGFGNFGPHYQKQLEASDGKVLGHAHNDFLNVLVAAGLFGLAAFLFFWKVLLFRIWEGLKKIRAGPERKFLFMGLASLGVYLAYAQFEASFFDQEVQMLLFFLLAASLAVLEVKEF